MVFQLAVTELEHAEWLVLGPDDEAEPLAEAREIFEQPGRRRRGSSARAARSGRRV